MRYVNAQVFPLFLLYIRNSIYSQVGGSILRYDWSDFKNVKSEYVREYVTSVEFSSLMIVLQSYHIYIIYVIT